jgi:hypothetical protein
MANMEGHQVTTVAFRSAIHQATAGQDAGAFALGMAQRALGVPPKPDQHQQPAMVQVLGDDGYLGDYLPSQAVPDDAPAATAAKPAWQQMPAAAAMPAPRLLAPTAAAFSAGAASHQAPPTAATAAGTSATAYAPTSAPAALVTAAAALPSGPPGALQQPGGGLALLPAGLSVPMQQQGSGLASLMAQIPDDPEKQKILKMLLLLQQMLG